MRCRTRSEGTLWKQRQRAFTFLTAAGQLTWRSLANSKSVQASMYGEP